MLYSPNLATMLAEVVALVFVLLVDLSAILYLMRPVGADLRVPDGGRRAIELSEQHRSELD